MSTTGNRIVIGFGIILAANAAASASVMVTSGVVDATATALTGRKGSSSGTLVHDPPGISGLSGTVTQTASITAGPVLPVDDDHPSLPGTRGVVTGEGVAGLRFTPGPGTLAIDGSASASNGFTDMDGGTYLGAAASGFKVEFTLTQATPWTLVGTAAFSPQDVTGLLRLIGPLDSIYVTRANNGPVSLSGVFAPGAYLFEAGTGVYKVPNPPTGGFSENSSVQATLTLVPEPASALLTGAGAAVAWRRRAGRRRERR